MNIDRSALAVLVLGATNLAAAYGNQPTDNVGVNALHLLAHTWPFLIAASVLIISGVIKKRRENRFIPLSEQPLRPAQSEA